jgi:LmbE family N-acetylglucosaminyl deacetylase
LLRQLYFVLVPDIDRFLASSDTCLPACLTAQAGAARRSQVRNRTLVTVFPHPDDESFASGGLLQAARRRGWRTVVVCLTRGEAGRNYLKGGTETLADIRERELKKAVGILGVDRLVLWDFPDAGVEETREEWTAKLALLLEEEKPGVVVSFDHSGVTGHPDHIISSVGVLAVLRKMKMKSRPRLFWMVPIPVFKERFRKSGTFDLIPEPTHRLSFDLPTAVRKVRAILSHRSQFPRGKMILIAAGHLLYRGELYHRVDFRRKYEHRLVDYEI